MSRVFPSQSQASRRDQNEAGNRPPDAGRQEHNHKEPSTKSKERHLQAQQPNRQPSFERLNSLPKAKSDRSLPQSQAGLHGQVFPRFGVAAGGVSAQERRGAASPQSAKGEQASSSVQPSAQSHVEAKGSPREFTDDSAIMQPADSAHHESAHQPGVASPDAIQRRPNPDLNRYFEERSHRRALASGRRTDSALGYPHSMLLPAELLSNRATDAQDDGPSYRSGSFSGHRRDDGRDTRKWVIRAQ